MNAQTTESHTCVHNERWMYDYGSDYLQIYLPGFHSLLFENKVPPLVESKYIAPNFVL